LATTGVIHELPLERQTVHGHFSCGLPPVLTIDSGDTIRLSTLQGGWLLEPGVFLEPRDPEVDSGHPLCGPVEVRGARAGQTLEIRIGSLRPSWWGATVAEDEVVPWELDADARTGRSPGGRVVELRPFLGVLGMPPPEQGVHSTVAPRLELETKPTDPRPWETFVRIVPNPKVPSLGEAMEEALGPEERERLTAHLRPLVEEGRGRIRQAVAYVSATKAGSA
jgi:hypothetical protein